MCEGWRAGSDEADSDTAKADGMAQQIVRVGQRARGAKMTAPKCFEPDPQKLALEVARFEAIVGSGKVEQIRAQTDSEAFSCDLIAAVHRYHATLKNRELGDLMRFKAQAIERDKAIRQYMGEDNYRSMLSLFGRG